MSQRRWFNPNVPQTLYIAQFLLYFDAFWMALGVLFGGGLGLLGLIALAAYVYGAYGIANEQKRGYQVAVVAAFIPLALPRSGVHDRQRVAHVRPVQRERPERDLRVRPHRPAAAPDVERAPEDLVQLSIRVPTGRARNGTE
ncbi:MAG: hypothetical protein V9E94_13340 [Microthrixaceae bacterium]